MVRSPKELEEVVLKSLRERNLLVDNAVVKNIIIKNEGKLLVVM